MEDLEQYNGDVEHDMWVDSDYHENMGELSEHCMAVRKGDFYGHVSLTKR